MKREAPVERESVQPETCGGRLLHESHRTWGRFRCRGRHNSFPHGRLSFEVSRPMIYDEDMGCFTKGGDSLESSDARRPPVAEGVTLYDHQRAGFERAMQVFKGEGVHGYGFLFEMGLGKSLTAIATMGQLFVEGRIERVLICVPTSVCAVWTVELKRFAGFPCACQILSGDS